MNDDASIDEGSEGRVIALNMPARYSVSADDVVHVMNDAGEEIFQQHIPGIYARVLEGMIPPTMSLGFKDGQPCDISFPSLR